MKKGTHHWWMQRVTSVVLLFLSLWFVYAFVETPLTSFGSAHQWLKSPLNALGVALGLFTGLYHGALGLQVVIEDYVHCPVGKMTLLILSKVGFVCLALAGGYALLKIHGIGV
jgi:succinate dehydrogenase / fumarate reductase membrane anchor subunit